MRKSLLVMFLILLTFLHSFVIQDFLFVFYASSFRLDNKFFDPDKKFCPQLKTFSGLFWRFPGANELSKSFYRHFSIAICLYFREVSGKIIFPDTFPETYLNSTYTCHFLYHKVSGKYVSGKIFPDSWKNVMILAANHVNDYLDARVCHSLQKNTTLKF